MRFSLYASKKIRRKETAESFKETNNMRRKLENKKKKLSNFASFFYEETRSPAPRHPPSSSTPAKRKRGTEAGRGRAFGKCGKFENNFYSNFPHSPPPRLFWSNSTAHAPRTNSHIFQFFLNKIQTRANTNTAPTTRQPRTNPAPRNAYATNTPRGRLND